MHDMWLISNNIVYLTLLVLCCIASTSADGPEGASGNGAAAVVGELHATNRLPPSLSGWLAAKGDTSPRHAEVLIDGERFSVLADSYRPHLERAGFGSGKHGFELSVPATFIDGQDHTISLVDKTTTRVLQRTTAQWSPVPQFHNLEGFLSNSFTYPVVYHPFTEAQKTVFAALDRLADTLALRANASAEPPLVTVVMPVHNRIALIRKATRTVLTQTYQNLELLVVDDGSTDGSLQWCRRLKDPRVRVVSIKERSGAAHARNAGLRRARGKYVMYLDTDNHWEPGFVAATVGAFLTLPDADALYSGQMVFAPDAAAGGPHKAQQRQEPLFARFGSINKALLYNKNYVDLNVFSHTIEMYRREGGFDEKMKRLMDWDMIVRYVRRGRVYSVPVLLSHYFFGKASNTVTDSATYVESHNRFRENHGACPRDAAEADREFCDVLKQDPVSTPLSRRVTAVVTGYQRGGEGALEACLHALAAAGRPGRRRGAAAAAGGKVSVRVLSPAAGVGGEGALDLRLLSGSDGALPAEWAASLEDAVASSGGAEAGDVLIIDASVALHPGAVEALQEAALGLQGSGLLTPQLIMPGGVQGMTYHAPYSEPRFSCDVSMSSLHKNVDDPTLFHNGEVIELNFTPLICIYMRREVMQKVGLPPIEPPGGDHHHHRHHHRPMHVYCDMVRLLHSLKIYHVSRAQAIYRPRRVAVPSQQTI